ncbi:unnamed protein product [Menidia menidia]|uniref:(Atlantic silverside) hypothetical protein n=1 Tax=Menidia menidia TaxID=238744 RepID=A0A8S4C3W7_9TELE|nr:unnamed protein product [Menidia menidia]
MSWPPPGLRAAAGPSLDHRELPASVCVSLQAANSSSAHGLELFYGYVGGDVTMKCSFSTSGRREVKFPPEKTVMEGLTRSDSGRYRCAVGRASHTDVELVVADGVDAYRPLQAKTLAEKRSEEGREAAAKQQSPNMSVHHTLLCLFFLSLQAANSSSAHGLELFYGHVGGGVTMKCSFSTSGRREVKSFCRENCDGGYKLIETESETTEHGRYRIHYSEQVLSVSITGLTRSDSGRYCCALGRTSHTEVELVVADALLKKSQQEPFSIEAGSSLTVGCTFKVSGNKKFCRGGCFDEGEILVQTDGVRAEKGRYRIGYVDGRFAGGVLYVSIAQLTQSDSGRYRCYLQRPGFDGSTEFSIQVSAVPTAYKPTDVPAVSTPAASTQSWSSSSGSSKPPASSHSAEPPQQEGAASKDMLLLVGLALAFVVFLFSVALLVFCRRRSVPPPKDRCEQTEYESINEDERGNQQTTPPVQISTIYSCASFPNLQGADDYSLLSAHSAQPEAAASTHKPIYAAADLSSRGPRPAVRAPSGGSDVVYSVPRLRRSSAPRRASDECLYSNVR